MRRNDFLGDRRMISTKIVGSARFLKMPVSSQCLYFHLVARADDDGITEAYAVMRTCGLNEDDLRVLHGKGFVYVLNEDLVTYIRNWREMNILRPDRKTDSRYLALLKEKLPEEEILQRKPRSDTKKGRQEALQARADLDGPRTAQDKLIQSNLNQNNLIEDKIIENQSNHLPPGEPDGAAVVRAVVADNINLQYLLDTRRRQGKNEEEMVREVYDMICDMVMKPRPFVKIKDRNIQWAVVKSRFMKLKSRHVTNVLDRIADQKHGIKNMQSYLVTALYMESLSG